MKILAWSTLRDFAKSRARHKDYKALSVALKAWHEMAKGAAWRTPADIKATDPTASILKDRRVVFNVCGNRYRLVVKVNYRWQVVYVRFIGTHEDYDAINAEEI